MSGLCKDCKHWQSSGSVVGWCLAAKDTPGEENPMRPIGMVRWRKGHGSETVSPLDVLQIEVEGGFLTRHDHGCNQFEAKRG